MLRALADLLAAEERKGALRIDDPLQAAGHLAALFKGMADMERRFASPESPEAGEARIASAVDLFLRAYRA
jgi:TetR/AcrR family transcriptional regulator, mexJK operon transcriptional repressor